MDWSTSSKTIAQLLSGGWEKQIYWYQVKNYQNIYFYRFIRMDKWIRCVKSYVSN